MRKIVSEIFDPATRYEFEPATPSDIVRALQIDAKFGELELGLVDGTVAAVAERRGVSRVLTADRADFNVIRVGPRYQRALTLLPSTDGRPDPGRHGFTWRNSIAIGAPPHTAARMRRLENGLPRGSEIAVDFEGDSIPAFEGEPVAVSLLAAGEQVFSRSVKYHRPRGPFCFAAACSHCLMRVDGVPNVFTCRTRARSGMRLERQNAFPTAKVDVFASIDWMFPRGLDHHEMFAGVPVAEKVMATVARHLAGLGLLPDSPAPSRLPAEILKTRVAIAGGGAAGLAAAEVLAARETPFILCEREAFLGGRLAVAAPEPDAPAIANAEAFPAGAARLEAAVIGLYQDEGGFFLAAVARETDGPRLLKLYADRFLLAVGGHSPILPFENNDLPGVFSGRAASYLVRRCGLLAFDRVAMAGHGPELYRTAELLERAGAKIVALVDTRAPPPEGGPALACHGEPIKAHGRSRVTGLSLRRKNGRARHVRCDGVVISSPIAPSVELARQGGARVGFRLDLGAFAVEADDGGRARAPHLYVAGDATGPTSASRAALSGRRAAEALLEGLR